MNYSDKSRWEKARDTIRHRAEVQRIAQEHGLSYPFHDLAKLFGIIFLGDEMATKLHRKYSPHHLQNGDIQNKEEAAIDWKSARFTKPDKPLDAYETWRKYYPEVDMEPTLRKLGFWHEEENEIKNFARLARKYFSEPEVVDRVLATRCFNKTRSTR